MNKHICGACKKEFDSEEKYLEHECEETGYTPTDDEHLDELSDGQFTLQREKALERGEK